MTVFSALKSDYQHSGTWFTLHTTFILYIADPVPFGEGLSMNIMTNTKHYLFIAIIIAEIQQNFLNIIHFQHIAFMFTESDINRTRKSRNNSLIESRNIQSKTKSHMYMYIAMQLLNKMRSTNDSN